MSHSGCRIATLCHPDCRIENPTTADSSGCRCCGCRIASWILNRWSRSSGTNPSRTNRSRNSRNRNHCRNHPGRLLANTRRSTMLLQVEPIISSYYLLYTGIGTCSEREPERVVRHWGLDRK